MSSLNFAIVTKKVDYAECLDTIITDFEACLGTSSSDQASEPSNPKSIFEKHSDALEHILGTYTDIVLSLSDADVVSIIKYHLLVLKYKKSVSSYTAHPSNTIFVNSRLFF